MDNRQLDPEEPKPPRDDWCNACMFGIFLSLFFIVTIYRPLLLGCPC